MKKTFRMAVPAIVLLLRPVGSAQSGRNLMSLCVLQEKAAEGSRTRTRVAGVFKLGLELGTLEDLSCPGKVTWVELALKSRNNKEKLREVLDRFGQARVSFDGEFYGPDVPDPKLPEAVRKSYHPGWGHLGAFRTKLVVYAIESVDVMRARTVRQSR
jgi:hypothetical protein